jgi:glycosyltransferase involved in cell wall biosynthesis
MTKFLDFLIIIPTHNRSGPLRAAIASVFSQTGVTTQIIVADDNPDGSAADVVNEFPEVIYLKTPEHSKGWPGRVRNYAFFSSLEMGIKANYVHFLDDDDTVAEGIYTIAKNTFIRYPKIGIIFGVMRPFCIFCGNDDLRDRQNIQLREVRRWRIIAGRYPWLYQDIFDIFKLRILTQWLFSLHATFGWEMFLCSAGIIRHELVSKLSGFPDVRITQDYFFYTEAIRKFGVFFLKKETAGYGVGDPDAVYSRLYSDRETWVAHTNEWTAEISLRDMQLKTQMGRIKYHLLKTIFQIIMKLLHHIIIPFLHKRGYFRELYYLTDPDHFGEMGTKTAHIHHV